MITPYNPRFSSNSFLTGSNGNPYPLASTTNTASTFDIGSTSSSTPVFQSSAFGIPASYPSSTASALDTGAISGVNGGLQQILSAIIELVAQLIKSLQTNSGRSNSGGSNSPNFDKGSSTQTKPSHAPAKQSHASNGDDSSSDPPPSTGDGTSSFKGADQANGNGWNKNVAVMASSSADKETMTAYSGGHAVGGYLGKFEEGLDKYDNVADVNNYAQKNSSDDAVSSGVTANSLVKGKGGNAVIVTGDNYGNDEDADQLADKLKKNYGMNVKVIKNASPNQLKAALQEMGQQNGEQCMVAVLAHGAKDDSGKNNGMIALGKGDGDQWLSEDALKSEVNQYLSPSYKNVNVMFNSCFSGNYVN